MTKKGASTRGGGVTKYARRWTRKDKERGGGSIASREGMPTRGSTSAQTEEVGAVDAAENAEALTTPLRDAAEADGGSEQGTILRRPVSPVFHTIT